MRAMKGLLLGSAAGLIAVTGAQAADLPVKAKPVEYVKVCSLYGAGFYYVPGTDTCLKFGMYLRSDHMYNVGPGTYNLPGTAQYFDRRDTRNYNYRARMALSTDWRTQTDYGTLRAYALLIFQQDSADATAQGVAGLHRAFIQWAGFTVGHAVSYFDFFNGAAYGYSPSIWIGSTGVVGTDLIAYTWQLGNGFSASINIEDGRTGRAATVINAQAAAQLTVGGNVNSAQALPTPDIAGSIRVDQAWGSAQVMAALHNINATYYSLPGVALGAGAAGTTDYGHPGSAWGWAVGAGFKINNAFGIPRDNIEFQIDYAEGATSYIYSIYYSNAWYGSGRSVGLGWASDGIYINGSGVEKTEAWGFAAAYQHHWSPQWRTSVVGGYTEINYSATARGWLCGAAGTGTGTIIGGVTTGTFSNCNPDFSMTALSTRTAWTPHPTLEIGLDLIWAHLDTAFAGTVNLPVAGARPSGIYTVEDQDYYGLVFRFQKTILP